MTHLRLGVNIDHVATVRNARGGDNPDPVRAAKFAQAAGADGITAHLREDRRHISDADIAALSTVLSIPLNLEMAATAPPPSCRLHCPGEARGAHHRGRHRLRGPAQPPRSAGRRARQGQYPGFHVRRAGEGAA
jgi:hypothetical protein